ncbi:immunoglobulin i-set domain-containing protein [Ditylenchus destructor]|nr:immunoglobulin i-set domain-containing protein [Ditylenchus destructor]
MKTKLNLAEQPSKDGPSETVGAVEPTRVKAGSRIAFNFQFVSPADFAAVWLKNGEELRMEDVTQRMEQRTTETAYLFTISQLEASDSGEYTLRFTNGTNVAVANIQVVQDDTTITQDVIETTKELSLPTLTEQIAAPDDWEIVGDVSDQLPISITAQISITIFHEQEPKLSEGEIQKQDHEILEKLSETESVTNEPTQVTVHDKTLKEKESPPSDFEVVEIQKEDTMVEKEDVPQKQEEAIPEAAEVSTDLLFCCPIDGNSAGIEAILMPVEPRNLEDSFSFAQIILRRGSHGFTPVIPSEDTDGFVKVDESELDSSWSSLHTALSGSEDRQATSGVSSVTSPKDESTTEGEYEEVRITEGGEEKITVEADKIQEDEEPKPIKTEEVQQKTPEGSSLFQEDVQEKSQVTPEAEPVTLLTQEEQKGETVVTGVESEQDHEATSEKQIQSDSTPKKSEVKISEFAELLVDELINVALLEQGPQLEKQPEVPLTASYEEFESSSEITTDIEMVDSADDLLKSLSLEPKFAKENTRVELQFRKGVAAENEEVLTFESRQLTVQELVPQIGTAPYGEQTSQLVVLHKSPETGRIEVAVADNVYEDASDQPLSIASDTSSTVYSPPVIIQSLADSVSPDLVSDSKAVFKCLFTGNPLPRAVWFLDDVEIETDQNVNAICEDGVALLIVNSIPMQWNEHDLVCEVQNSAGKTRSKQKLDIRGFEESVSHFELHNVEHFKEIEMDAGGETEAGIRVTILLPLFAEEYRQITIEDDNRSVCSTVSGLSPYFTTDLPQSVYIKEYDDLVLKCHCVGNPAPVLQWKKNGSMIPSSKKYRITVNNGEARLRIFDIHWQDCGVYTCEAVNDVGRCAAVCSVSMDDEQRSEARIFLNVLCDKEYSGASLEVDVVHTVKESIHTIIEMTEAQTTSVQPSASLQKETVPTQTQLEVEHADNEVAVEPLKRVDQDKPIEIMEEGTMKTKDQNAIESAPVTEEPTAGPTKEDLIQVLAEAKSEQAVEKHTKEHLSDENLYELLKIADEECNVSLVFTSAEMTEGVLISLYEMVPEEVIATLPIQKIKTISESQKPIANVIKPDNEMETNEKDEYVAHKKPIEEQEETIMTPGHKAEPKPSRIPIRQPSQDGKSIEKRKETSELLTEDKQFEGVADQKTPSHISAEDVPQQLATTSLGDMPTEETLQEEESTVGLMFECSTLEESTFVTLLEVFIEETTKLTIHSISTADIEKLVTTKIASQAEDEKLAFETSQKVDDGSEKMLKKEAEDLQNLVERKVEPKVEGTMAVEVEKIPDIQEKPTYENLIKEDRPENEKEVAKDTKLTEQLFEELPHSEIKEEEVFISLLFDFKGPEEGVVVTLIELFAEEVLANIKAEKLRRKSQITGTEHELTTKMSTNEDNKTEAIPGENVNLPAEIQREAEFKYESIAKPKTGEDTNLTEEKTEPKIESPIESENAMKLLNKQEETTCEHITEIDMAKDKQEIGKAPKLTEPLLEVLTQTETQVEKIDVSLIFDSKSPEEGVIVTLIEVFSEGVIATVKVQKAGKKSQISVTDENEPTNEKLDELSFDSNKEFGVPPTESIQLALENEQKTTVEDNDLLKKEIEAAKDVIEDKNESSTEERKTNREHEKRALETAQQGTQQIEDVHETNFIDAGLEKMLSHSQEGVEEVDILLSFAYGSPEESVAVAVIEIPSDKILLVVKAQKQRRKSSITIAGHEHQQDNEIGRDAQYNATNNIDLHFNKQMADISIDVEVMCADEIEGPISSSKASPDSKQNTLKSPVHTDELYPMTVISDAELGVILGSQETQISLAFSKDATTISILCELYATETLQIELKLPLQSNIARSSLEEGQGKNTTDSLMEISPKKRSITTSDLPQNITEQPKPDKYSENEKAIVRQAEAHMTAELKGLEADDFLEVFLYDEYDEEYANVKEVEWDQKHTNITQDMSLTSHTHNDFLEIFLYDTYDTINSSITELHTPLSYNLQTFSEGKIKEHSEELKAAEHEEMVTQEANYRKIEAEAMKNAEADKKKAEEEAKKKAEPEPKTKAEADKKKAEEEAKKKAEAEAKTKAEADKKKAEEEAKKKAEPEPKTKAEADKKKAEEEAKKKAEAEAKTKAEADKKKAEEEAKKKAEPEPKPRPKLTRRRLRKKPRRRPKLRPRQRPKLTRRRLRKKPRRRPKLRPRTRPKLTRRRLRKKPRRRPKLRPRQRPKLTRRRLRKKPRRRPKLRPRQRPKLTRRRLRKKPRRRPNLRPKTKAEADKKKAEEEAKKKAEAEAKTKAEADKKKAEEEAKKKAEAEAKTKAEADKKKAEEEAKKKAEAEAKTKAEADKKKAEEEAKKKAEPEPKTKAEADKKKAEEEAKKKAEAEAKTKAEADKKKAEEEAKKKAEPEPKTKAEADKKKAEEEAKKKAEADKKKVEEEAKKKAEPEPKTKAEADKKKAEEEAKKKAEAEAKTKAEADKKKAEEEAKKKAEAEAKTKAEADKKKAEEEAKKKAEAEPKTKAEADKKKAEEEAKKKAEAEAKTKAEADKKKAEEEAKKKAEAEAKTKAEADKKKAEEEAKKKAEAEPKTKAEADKKKAEEEAKKKAEAEAKQKAEADKKKAEEEAKKKAEAVAKDKAEADKKQAEDEAKKKAVAEAKTKAEADKKKAEEEAKKKAEAEAKTKAEADKKKAEEEAKKKAEAEAKTKAEADKKKAEEEAKKKAEAEAKTKAEADKKKAEEEAKKKAEAEAKTKAEADKKKAEEEAKKKAEAEAKTKAEADKKKAEEEAKKKAEAEAKTKAEADKKKAEEEAKKKAEAEAKTKAEADKKKAEEEAKKKAEAEAKQRPKLTRRRLRKKPRRRPKLRPKQRPKLTRRRLRKKPRRRPKLRPRQRPKLTRRRLRKMPKRRPNLNPKPRPKLIRRRLRKKPRRRPKLRPRQRPKLTRRRLRKKPRRRPNLKAEEEAKRRPNCPQKPKAEADKKKTQEEAKKKAEAVAKTGAEDDKKKAEEDAKKKAEPAPKNPRPKLKEEGGGRSQEECRS